MSTRERMGLAALVLLTVAAPVIAGVVVLRSVPDAHAARSPYEALFVDSSRADSVAFDALPTRLGALLDVRPMIDGPDTVALRLHECLRLPAREPGELRRRLRLRLPDTSAAVLYAVADEGTGRLARVEFIRRMPNAGQRGFIWDGARDRTTSVWWFETPRGLSRREERGDLPRGGPVPRAIRALGRQLLVAPCADSAANSPMNPISGSRD